MSYSEYDVEEYEEDDANWEDDVPSYWWADFPYELVAQQYEAAMPETAIGLSIDQR